MMKTDKRNVLEIRFKILTLRYTIIIIVIIRNIKTIFFCSMTGCYTAGV